MKKSSESGPPEPKRVTYRTFVSYFSRDKRLMQLVVDALRGLGHDVWCAPRAVSKGIAFDEEIRRAIQRAHFLVPVMTRSASTSPWVQQEVGYAFGCSVGVLPVIVGTRLGNQEALAMLGAVQAATPTRASKRAIMEELAKVNWEEILDRIRLRCEAIFRCDTDQKSRSELIERTARDLARRPQHARVMQRSTLTTFSLPSARSSSHWSAILRRWDETVPPWFRPPERSAMETLADSTGCDLILDPCFSRRGYSADVQAAKLRTLREFFAGRRDSIRVVLRRFLSAESEMFLGDFWMAHSAAVGRFETQCEMISTWHAPTVGYFSTQFQKEFDDLYQQQEALREGRPSSEFAVQAIDCALRRLAGKRTVPPPCRRCVLRWRR